jgi:uncharacterized cupredoxin-like copper-binding protein
MAHARKHAMNNFHRCLPLLFACFGLIGFCAHTASAQGSHQDDHGAARATTGEGGSFGQPGAAKNATRTIAIAMNDSMRFDPGAVSIKQGETVRLRITNAGRIEHEFVLGTAQEIAEHARMMRGMPDMVHADANAVRVAPGKTADLVWKFSVPGKFLYACLVPGHLEAGMRGSITVASSGSAKARK